jgi:ferritin
MEGVIVMLNKKLQKALNDQMNAELYSSYLYLSMSAYFESVNMAGFASWMRVQVQEELAHVAKFFGYVTERGGRVELAAIDGPPTEWESPLAAFEQALAHERMVTGRINDLVDLSIQERDHATNGFLQWFVTEQVEEEATADGVVQKIKLVGGDGGGLFMIDQELGKRIFTPPAASSEA